MLAGYTSGPSSGRVDGDEDGPVVHPSDAFDSRLRGNSVLLGSSPTRTSKKDISGW